MPERKRYREAVVVFIDVEAADEADALTVAEILVKAQIRGEASLVGEIDPRAMRITHDYRGAVLSGRIVAAEHLAIAMARSHLAVDATRLPWRHLDGEDDVDTLIRETAGVSSG